MCGVNNNDTPDTRQKAHIVPHVKNKTETLDFEPIDVITIWFLLKYAFIVNKGPYNLKKNTSMNLEFSFKVSLWTHTIKCHYQFFLLLKFPGYSHFQIHVINQPIWKGPIMQNVHRGSTKSGK